MKDKTLLKISLVTTVIGILILLFILDRISLSNSNLSNITKDNLDENIKIKAELVKITETPGLYILTVRDFSGIMTVIVFKDESLELKEGDVLEIEGRVTSYNGKLEIIAKKITII